jgi:hypothetical protein
MQQESKRKPKLVDSPVVTEQFSDHFVGYATHGDVVSLTFAVHRSTYSTPAEIHRVVSARVALTAAAAKGLHEALSRWRESVELGSAGKITAGPETVQ